MDKLPLAFDTETHLFGPYNMAPKIVCLSWAFFTENGMKSGVIKENDKIEKWLHQILDKVLNKSIQLIGHYTAYDACCILSNFPSVWDKLWKAYEINGITCTAIRARLLDIHEGIFRFRKDEEGNLKKCVYSLDDLGLKYFNTKIEKGEDTWRKRYSELENVALDDWPLSAIKYAESDAKFTLSSYLHQNELARYINYSMPTEYDEVRADFCLRLMSNWGIEIDQERAQKLYDDSILKTHSYADELLKSKLFEPKKKHPPIVPQISQNMAKTRELIQTTYKGESIPLTPKGKIQTSIDVIQDCDSPILKLLIEYRALQKTISTYLSHMLVPIMHASFFAIGACSDRTSSAKVNLQNQPRLPGVRECYRTRKGQVFLMCDYDSQEMRTLAQTFLDICGNSRLANKFIEDRYFDPHLEFAAYLANVSLDEAKMLHKNKDSKILDLRQRAKVSNFGYAGGMGAKTFVTYAKGYDLIISLQESEHLKTTWKQQWPEIKPYFDYIQHLVGRMGEGNVTIPQSGFVRGGCGYNDAANTHFQTLAAHASKSALWAVCKKAYTDSRSALFGSKPVLFIHDEIGMETPQEIAHEAAQEIEQAMIESMEKWTPNIPSAASATLMYRWSKKAKRVIKNGRLVPWSENETDSD